MTLRAGFAQCDITPPLGLPLGGYGARVAGADAVLDPLSCRVAVLDDDGSPVVLVALDLVHVFGEWVGQVRSRLFSEVGVATERVLVAATHTHSGPGVFRSSIERDERLVTYERELIDRIVACVGVARRAVTPVDAGFGDAPVTGIAANRRDPAAPADDRVRTVSLRSSDTLVGVIAQFTCHPTILPAANHAYSGDLLGVAASVASELLGAPVLLLNGAAGDVSTRFTRREQTHAELSRMGRILAEGIVRSVRDAAAMPAESLAAEVRTVAVGWRNLPTPDAAGAHLQAAARVLDDARARNVDGGELRLAQSRVEGAQAELWVASRGGWAAVFGEHPAHAELQVVRCGEVALLAVPGELFCSAGHWLSDQLRERALVVGYANDYLGYFIPETDVRAGGYEALIAMVDPACEAIIRDGLVRTALAAGCSTKAATA